MTVMLKPGIIMIPLTEEENTAVFHAARDGQKTVQIRKWEIQTRKIKAYGNIFPAEPKLLKELLVWGDKDYVAIQTPTGKKYDGKFPGGNYAWDYYCDIPRKDMTLSKSYESAVARMCSDIDTHIKHAVIFAATSVRKVVQDVVEEIFVPVTVGDQQKHQKDVTVIVP